MYVFFERGSQYIILKPHGWSALCTSTYSHPGVSYFIPSVNVIHDSFPLCLSILEGIPAKPRSWNYISLGVCKWEQVNAMHITERGRYLRTVWTAPPPKFPATRIRMSSTGSFLIYTFYSQKFCSSSPTSKIKICPPQPSLHRTPSSLPSWSWCSCRLCSPCWYALLFCRYGQLTPKFFS